MAFDWKSYVDLAGALVQQASNANNSEAMLRTALSRAYYGAFGYARNYAQEWLKFVPRNDTEDHGRLRAHLKSRRREGDGLRLERLRLWRNECDYLDELSFKLQAEVSTAIKEAEKVIASLVPPVSHLPRTS